MTESAAIRLVYVGDPMCSWCWGFAPVLERLIDRHGLEHRLIVGGLRPGDAAQPLTDRMKSFLLHHWDQVSAASGQPFDRAALERRERSWRYDTELPAIAVVTMRRLEPASELRFFVALQEAFYARGVDITRESVYPALVRPFGIESDAFMGMLTSQEARRSAWEDFGAARSLGVTGFPTTLLETGGRLRMLAAGFRAFSEVDVILHAAIERFAPPGYASTGAVCAGNGG